MVYYLLLAKWAIADAKKAGTKFKASRRGEFRPDELKHLNEVEHYNVYYLPNYPSKVITGRPTDGRDVDTWGWVFADMDLKDEVWPSKEAFIEHVKTFPLEPTAIVDSGRGVHVYWNVTDLDAMSFLRLQRRLSVKFKTDPAVANMHQLLRVPGTVNVKDPDSSKWVECQIVESSGAAYDAQTLDKHLPKISLEDEEKCVEHFNKTMQDPTKLAPKDAAVLPDKWHKLFAKNEEVKKLFTYQEVKDRSTADYRLAHVLLAQGFNRDEARAVLMNTGKAAERSSIHQYNYAQRMVDKIWEDVKEGKDTNPTSPIVKEAEELGETVSEVLAQMGEAERAIRFPCDPAIDGTYKGFRLGQMFGLVGGSGVGKTTFSLNMFRWFYENNPEYIHIFVTLEQPKDEIAERWKQMTADDPVLHSKVYIVGNYDKDGLFRNLGYAELEAYVKHLEKKTGKKVGCVVVDHIAIVKYEGKNKEMKDKLSGLCEQSKQFAVSTNTFLIVQSQTSRSKAGVGDIELDKDAAYGTGYFEFYADYIMTTWQPLKRLYGEPNYGEHGLYVNCWKYAKLRHKKVNLDKTQEDQVYAFRLNLDNDRFETLNEDQHGSFDFLAKKAGTLRNRDKKTNAAPLRVITWTQPVDPNEPPKKSKRLTASKERV